MTEDLLIRHAAPTLAGLKTANLVNCRCDNAENLLSALSSPPRYAIRTTSIILYS